MTEKDINKVYAEIINGILLKYCDELKFNGYSDFEFLVFYATKDDGEKAVGAISGNIDNEFVEGAHQILTSIHNSCVDNEKSSVR